MDPGYQPVTVSLSDEVVAAIQVMAERDGITVTEVLRRAVSVKKFLDDLTECGTAVLIREPGSRRMKRITIR